MFNAEEYQHTGPSLRTTTAVIQEKPGRPIQLRLWDESLLIVHCPNPYLPWATARKHPQ